MKTGAHGTAGGSRPAPLVSVIVPVRNEGERIAVALRSIIAGRSEDFPLELVVVDDDSSDGCCDHLEQLYSRDQVTLQVIKLPRWSGIPFARNAGAAAARAPILFITDANVIFPADWDIPIRKGLGLDRVLCAAIGDLASPFVGYGCTLLIPSMGIGWLPKSGSHGGRVPVSPCTGTVISADLFRRSGGYDTAMPIYGAAEPEFSVRLWLCGAEIVVAPDLVLRHRFRPAAERRPFLDAISLVQICNYLRFGMLYLDRDGVSRMLEHYSAAAPAIFPEAYRRVCESDVWERRRVLSQRLPVRFASYAERFGLDSGGGKRTSQ